MNLDKMLIILRAISILNALRSEEGSYRLGEISQWSRIPRATCDRYLVQMVDLGILDKTPGEYASQDCRLFAINQEGRALVEIYQA